jgi:hypothetical protein
MAAISNNIRIIPRDSDFLDRKLGSKGEVFYDQTTNSLRLFDGVVSGGHKLAKSDLTNITNAAFYSKAQAAGVGAAGITSFSNISVLGQVTLEAESSSDTLNIVAGTGITITTNVSTDTLTINADSYTLPVATTNSIGGVKVDGTTITITDGVISSQGSQSVSLQEFTFNVAADDSTQREITNGNTVKFIGAGSVTTSTNADGNVTITGAAATVFSSLSDVSSASLTVDKIYLPAMTMLNVTNNSASAYRFDQYGSTNNPTIFVISGTTVAFNLQATGHPFQLQDNTLTNISTGLVHVSTTGVVSTGSSAQGKDSGTLYWKIPASLGGVNYAYQCSVHGVMVGTITIKGIASI